MAVPQRGWGFEEWERNCASEASVRKKERRKEAKKERRKEGRKEGRQEGRKEERRLAYAGASVMLGMTVSSSSSLANGEY